MPTYHNILAEFERRTNQPAPALPSPVDLFSEFEKRTGEKL